MDREKKYALLPGPTRHAYALLSLTLLLLLAACGEPTPTPFPTAGAEPSPTSRPLATVTAVPLRTYHNESGGFSVQLPATWEVEAQGVTALGEYYQLGPAPVGPGPASSALFVVPTGELTAEAAAERLLCGGGCAAAVALEESEVAGRPAVKSRLETAEATLEWFFVEHRQQLIFFTLHDPQTLATRADLVATFSFAEAAATPTRGATPTATPVATATPEGPTTEWESWQRVQPRGAGITFEIPEQWVAQSGENWAWGPVAESAVRVRFRWQPLAPDQPLPLLLPTTGEIVTSSPLTLTLSEGLADAFYRGEQVMVQGEAGWEEHALFQVGLRAYDLSVAGPARGSLAALAPVLEQAVASAALDEVQLAFADPIEATVAWFQAAIQDPAGRDARAYMSPALRAQVAEGSSPLTLLALDERLVVYNLTWLSGTQSEALVEAELELLDGSVVRRQLTLARDPLAGWQVARIEPIPE